jgi:hypothetical protein
VYTDETIELLVHIGHCNSVDELSALRFNRYLMSRTDLFRAFADIEYRIGRL